MFFPIHFVSDTVIADTLRVDTFCPNTFFKCVPFWDVSRVDAKMQQSCGRVREGGVVWGGCGVGLWGGVDVGQGEPGGAVE